ncbi:MAG: PHP domain-containing protein [Selenomonadaceae bacterium]|nr:PHP domain-containing protein [Selenomonadaceae bacterium]
MSSDLHIHTTFSDGRLTPEEVLAAAKEAGLSTIAITDHDTVDGIRHLYENEKDVVKGMTIIPGIELSSEYEGREVHILGYNIDIYSSALADGLIEIGEDRWQRLAVMLEKLRELGYDITEAEVLKVAGASSSVSRSHVARVLVKKGYFQSVRSAFDEMLGQDKPAYVPRYRINAAEAVELVRAAGGLPVIAHPLLIGSDAVVSKLLKLDVAGIEVHYPQHNGDDVLRYGHLAELHDLLKTGGSDFHGIPGRYPEKLGEFVVDDKLAEPFVAAMDRP